MEEGFVAIDKMDFPTGQQFGECIFWENIKEKVIPKIPMCVTQQNEDTIVFENKLRISHWIYPCAADQSYSKTGLPKPQESMLPALLFFEYAGVDSSHNYNTKRVSGIYTVTEEEAIEFIKEHMNLTE